MSDLRFTDTNAADDSAGRVFGLDGNLYLAVVIAGLASVGIFAVLSLWLHTNWALAGVIAALPPGLTAIWAVWLKHGRPAGYDRDRLEDLLRGGDFGPAAGAGLAGRSHDRAPDGRLVDDMLVFGSPDRGGVVAKGFWLEPPDLRGASIARLNAFQEQVRGLLALIAPGRRLQLQWSCDADYRAELLRYHAATQGVGDPLVRRTRNERFMRYWQRMQSRELRRERLPMDDADHCACVRSFLNPSFARRTTDDAAGAFDPALTIQENCWHSEGVGQTDGGFHPRRPFSCGARPRPLAAADPAGHRHAPDGTAVPRLRHHGQRHAGGSAAGSAARSRPPSASAANTPRSPAHRCSSRCARRSARWRRSRRLCAAVPCHLSDPVWAPTREALREKVAAVQAAVHAMDGAQYSNARCRPRRRSCSSPRGRAGRIRPTATANSTRRTPTSPTCCPSPRPLSVPSPPPRRSTTAATAIWSASAPRPAARRSTPWFSA
jgi:hypothetical protein